MWCFLVFCSLAKWKITSDYSIISTIECLVKLIYVTVVTFVVSLCAEDCRGAERSKVKPACGPGLCRFRAASNSLAANEQQDGHTASNPV